MDENFTKNEYKLKFSETIEELKKIENKRRKLASKKLTLSEKMADVITRTIGTWTFIIIQSFIWFAWIILNITAFVKKWDPYPFIFLNLILSFQGAYTAPIIMMSQNRQDNIDRAKAEEDYYINLKAGLEIELLHQKIDFIRRNLIEMREELKD